MMLKASAREKNNAPPKQGVKNGLGELAGQPTGQEISLIHEYNSTKKFVHAKSVPNRRT